MARTKTKRGRGRPSFENSYKQRRKIYNRYKRIYKKKAQKYGDNMTFELTYKEFVDEYSRRRQDAKNTGQSASLSGFVDDQVFTTKTQASAATSNFNNHLDEMRAKAKLQGEDKLNEYEREMLDAFGYDAEDDYLKVSDTRANNGIYQTAYDIARRHGMGSEAFGS